MQYILDLNESTATSKEIAAFVIAKLPELEADVKAGRIPADLYFARCVGGASRRTAYIESFRAANKNALVYDTGGYTNGAHTGSAFLYEISKGGDSKDVFANIGYSAFGLNKEDLGGGSALMATQSVFLSNYLADLAKANPAMPKPIITNLAPPSNLTQHFAKLTGQIARHTIVQLPGGQRVAMLQCIDQTQLPGTLEAFGTASNFVEYEPALRNEIRKIRRRYTEPVVFVLTLSGGLGPTAAKIRTAKVYFEALRVLIGNLPELNVVLLDDPAFLQGHAPFTVGGAAGGDEALIVPLKDSEQGSYLTSVDIIFATNPAQPGAISYGSHNVTDVYLDATVPDDGFALRRVVQPVATFIQTLNTSVGQAVDAVGMSSEYTTPFASNNMCGGCQAKNKNGKYNLPTTTFSVGMTKVYRNFKDSVAQLLNQKNYKPDTKVAGLQAGALSGDNRCNLDDQYGTSITACAASPTQII